MDTTSAPTTDTAAPAAAELAPRDCRCCKEADSVRIVGGSATTRDWRCSSCGATWMEARRA